MDAEKNPYYNPEAFGYKTVDTVSWDSEPYQFDFTAVWVNEAGELLWASDSGCSCPMPFEYHTEADFHKGTKFQLMKYVSDRLIKVSETSYIPTEVKNYAAQQVLDLTEKLMLGEYK